MIMKRKSVAIALVMMLISMVTFESCNSSKSKKVMSIAGTYQYDFDYTDEDFGEDDDLIKSLTIKGESRDRFMEDGTELDRGPINFKFRIEDEDGYKNNITLSYVSSYSGTWEQRGLTILLVGKNCSMTFIHANTKYSLSDDDYYIDELKNWVEEVYLPILKASSLGERELTIKSLTRERMIILEDDEEMIYTRID